MPGILMLAAETPSLWQHVRAISSVTDQGPVLASFVKNVMKDGAKNLGIIATNQIGTLQMKDRYIAAAKELGMKVVDVQVVEQNQSTFTAELLNLQKAHVENLAILTGLEVVGILRDAKALNYQPRFTGAQWLIDSYSQAARNLMDGIMGVQGMASRDATAYPAF